MRNRVIGRNLKLCFSKMMRPLTPESPPPLRDHSSSSSSILNNSLYDHILDSSSGSEAEAADLATAFASERFFFSSPGHSNSIVPVRRRLLFSDSVAVATYSPDPFTDFRRSMQEMVEARPELRDVKHNWEMLEELLLCYLALNPHTTHTFILAAFADLLLSLMSHSHSAPS